MMMVNPYQIVCWREKNDKSLLIAWGTTFLRTKNLLFSVISVLASNLTSTRGRQSKLDIIIISLYGVLLLTFSHASLHSSDI